MSRAAARTSLRTDGIMGASARVIARHGDFNQALIFYHFGSLNDLFIAVLDVQIALIFLAFALFTLLIPTMLRRWTDESSRRRRRAFGAGPARGRNRGRRRRRSPGPRDRLFRRWQGGRRTL